VRSQAFHLSVTSQSSGRRRRAGGKKVRARRRHILVDIEGFLLKVKVHSARVPNQDGLRLLLESIRAETPPLSPVGGRRLPRRRQGVGGELPRPECRSRACIAPRIQHPRRSCSPGRGSGIRRAGTSTSRRCSRASASRYCHGAGLRRGPSRSCVTTAARVRTTGGCARLPRPTYTRR
jgi:hypothetical protein